MKADRSVKTESEIVYSADTLETERLMSVPLEHAERGFNAFLDALPTFFTNLLGVVVGAGLSFFFFQEQQRVLAKSDELKVFRQRKLEKANELLTFFRDVYPDFRTDSDKRQSAQNLRRALVESGIYSMLPLEVMDELNRICDSAGPFLAARGKMLDDLLRANFRELMV